VSRICDSRGLASHRLNTNDFQDPAPLKLCPPDDRLMVPELRTSKIDNELLLGAQGDLQDGVSGLAGIGPRLVQVSESGPSFLAFGAVGDLECLLDNSFTG